jgi:phospholipase C
MREPANLVIARQLENGLADGYYKYLLKAGQGSPADSPTNASPTTGRTRRIFRPVRISSRSIPQPTYPYDAYAASPVHRFYQMYQQLDCDAAASTERNGWGCRSDLFPWVEVTVAAGSNGKARPPGYTGEGATAMGFFNVQQGDAP